ncbi:MAG: endonuclease/exonuclease/phosphatase family protein [Gemmatimonadetes bacterium]|nr:endonuclease/exonuclease/phosphatase family protein [Gemmatimonadota bacterium]
MLPLLLAAIASLVNAPPAPGAPPSFRVLEWNVSDSAWIRHRAASRAVLRSADPDIVVLVQVSGGTGVRGVREMLAGLRNPADTTWFVTSRVQGDYEHTVIASRYPVRALSEFDRVAYPDTGRAVARATPMPGETVPQRDTVDLARTNGALVRVADRWLLVVGLHLTCCGTRDDWREARRRLAATAVRDRTRAAMARTRPAGVVMAGDMNLVGGRAPLDTLLATIAAPPLGPLRRAPAVHFDGWTDWTWDGRGTPFNAGRLDNIVYSTGTLDLLRARVWDTESMDADTLRAYGLMPETSRTIGRHRPVVVDLRFSS